MTQVIMEFLRVKQWITWHISKPTVTSYSLHLKNGNTCLLTFFHEDEIQIWG